MCVCVCVGLCVSSVCSCMRGRSQCLSATEMLEIHKSVLLPILKLGLYASDKYLITCSEGACRLGVFCQLDSVFY